MIKDERGNVILGDIQGINVIFRGKGSEVCIDQIVPLGTSKETYH